MSEWFWASVDIEVSNICDNGCSICPRDKISRPIGMMSMETFERVVGLIEKKGRLITFSGIGDPLSHPDIFKMLKIVGQTESDSGIVINPGSLNANLIDRLINAAPNVISVSFPSLRKTVFEKIVPGVAFEYAIEITRKLIDFAAGKAGVRVLGVETLLNSDEKESFTRFWKRPGVGANMAPCHGRGGNLEAPGIYERHDNSNFTELCGMFGFHTFITWEADVLACCHDLIGETRMGNIVKDGVGTIVKRKRDVLKKGEMFRLCRNCDEPLRLCRLPSEPVPTDKTKRNRFFRTVAKRMI